MSDLSVFRGDAVELIESLTATEMVRRLRASESAPVVPRPLIATLRDIAASVDEYAVEDVKAALEEAAKALDAESAPKKDIPVGWKLVPVEPTEAMLDALGDSPWIVECDTKVQGDNTVVTTRREYREQRYVVDGWQAMLKAAPDWFVQSPAPKVLTKGDGNAGSQR